MSSKPLVTIITPVYNCAKYIEATISSVMEQNYPNIRYLVIDDGSTDNPQYPQDSETLKVVKHVRNKGEQARVNEGLAMVGGKYFMIVNADDPLLPGAVWSLVAFMEANPDVLCGYPNYTVVGEDGNTRMRVATREYDFIWMVRHHTWLPSVGAIFRSDVIKQVGYRDESFTWLGDADYWLRVGLAGRMAHINSNLSCWRKRSGQASSDKSWRRAAEHIRVMQKFYAIPDLPRELVEVRAEATCWSYLVAAVVTSSKVEVLKYAFRAVKSYPRMLVDIRFWDLFIKRALFILRR